MITIALVSVILINLADQFLEMIDVQDQPQAFSAALAVSMMQSGVISW